MAEPKRKKKLDKQNPAELTPEQYSKNCFCTRCGTPYSRRKGYFPASHSPMYRGLGYVPICNTCLDNMFDAYCRELGPKEALHRMCMKLDIYWAEEIYEVVERTAATSSRIRSYLGRSNLIKYVNKNYDDTLRELSLAQAPMRIIGIEETVAVESENPNNFIGSTEVFDEEEIALDPEVVEFWGAEFKPEFIQKLDKRYRYWTGDAGDADLDKGSIALYKQICILEETITRDAAEGKPIDKNQSMLNTLLGSANLKPVQKKSEADLAMENTPFGVWIDRWENKRPIPEPDPAFQDVDGIVKYITTWFYGHICKTLGIKNVYCKMYEDEINRMKVERPDLIDEDIDEDDSESLFNSIFGVTGE